jgi:2-(1,2-epoxy-1,2-dihydrophenyl)acetyl-CoA isomerase
VAYEHLLFTCADDVATVTLNRPERLNALNRRLGLELLDALARCAADTAVRCVVLTGAGRAFCAGDDLKEGTAFSEQTADTPREEVERRYVAGEGRWPQIVLAIRELPKPVVAAVNGYAFGAGLNLALACDFRIAAASATLAAPFVKRGMATGTNLLHEYVGIGVAARLVLTGEPMTAQEAERWGLITRVVPDGELTEATRAFAAELARAATAALGFTKAALYEGWHQPPARAYALQGYAVYQSGRTEDRAEGQRAFLEKRPPQFRGR